MGVQIFTVAGMSCDHCVRAVTQEVVKLAGVQKVDVDLASGAVRVAATHPLGETEMAAAIDEAGYKLVPDRSQQPR